MAGTIYFNNSPQQFVQQLNNEEKAYPCPILQAQRQRQQLQAFLQNHHFTEVPIVYLVVISHPHCVMKFAPNFHQTKQFVIQASSVPDRINSIQSNHEKEHITSKEVSKLGRLLIKKHVPYIPDYADKLVILKSEFLTGVQCPYCFQLPMKRVKGQWYCGSCKQTSKNAHIAALKDYSLLIHSTITNQQLREFLYLPSTSVASKLLTSLGLKSQGTFKDRVYLLEDLVED